MPLRTEPSAYRLGMAPGCGEPKLSVPVDMLFESWAGGINVAIVGVVEVPVCHRSRW